MKQIILALIKAIESNNFEEIDSILETIYTSWKYSQEQINNHYDFLQEATLFAELKEDEYKNEALNIINKNFDN